MSAGTLTRWIVPIRSGLQVCLSIDLQTCEVVMTTTGTGDGVMTSMEACQLGQAFLSASRDAGAMKAAKSARRHE